MVYHQLTFTPAINEKSARLAEVHEARRALLSFNHLGTSGSSRSSTSNGNEDKPGGAGGRTGGGEGKSSTDDSTSLAEETVTKPFEDHRRARGVGKRAPSKAVAKSLRLYSEHAEIERRKEQMRKVEKRYSPLDVDLESGGRFMVTLLDAATLYIGGRYTCTTIRLPLYTWVECCTVVYDSTDADSFLMKGHNITQERH